MAKATDNGGPAFPHSYAQAAGGLNGMSLRDWFAGMALQGMLSSEIYMREIDVAAESFVGDDDWRPTDAQKKRAQINVLSRTAFDLADAMLRARSA